MHSRISNAWRHAIDLDGFRDAFPNMVVRPGPPDGLLLVGEFSFRGSWDGTDIEDEYELEIVVPHSFPRDLPRTFERRGRIPASFHTNRDDCSLCLGSPLRLQRLLAAQPSLLRYADKCLVPYLYAHTVNEKTGKLPWADLQHGAAGLLQDYLQMFGAEWSAHVVAYLGLLATRRRVANKQPCPCRSGRRLGRCHARILNPFRPLWSRNRFRTEWAQIRKHVEQVRPCANSLLPM
jgi:hypothetical protein